MPSRQRVTRSTPQTFFDVTTAGTTLMKTAWPGSYTVTLPSAGSGSIAVIYSGSSAVGAVVAAGPNWQGLLMDFAGVGGADLTLAVEIGRLNASGAIPTVMAAKTLASITTSGTVANVNPFTGVATASVTWRLFDTVGGTDYCQLGQILTNNSGTDTPSQLLLDTVESFYYYAIVTSLGTMTRALCVVTPQ